MPIDKIKLFKHRIKDSGPNSKKVKFWGVSEQKAF